jgi:hypothetical protein
VIYLEDRLDAALKPWQRNIKPGDVTVVMQRMGDEVVPTFFRIEPPRKGNEDEDPTPKNYLECRVFTKHCPEGEYACLHRAVMQGKLDSPDDLEIAREHGFKGAVRRFMEWHDGTPLLFYMKTRTFYGKGLRPVGTPTVL